MTSSASTYVDAESVTRSGDRVEYDETMVYLDAPFGMARSLTRQSADCRSFELRTLRITAFLSDGTSDSWVPPRDPVTAPAGTVYHSSISGACSLQWRGGTVADPVADANGRGPGKR